MKKLLYILPLTVAFLFACGGGTESTEGTDETESTEEVVEAAEGTATDLSDFGLPYALVIPDAGSAQISENDWGGVEIVNGDGFMISLSFGEGNLELLKSDLNDDAVYTSTILDEGENYIVYKREIPDAGVTPEVHFMYVATFGEDVIEVQNMKDVTYEEGAIKTMLSSAKSMTTAGGI